MNIPLTQGYFASVDPEDFDRFGGRNWAANVQTKSGIVVRVYAFRGVARPDGRTKMVYLHREIMGAQEGDPGIDHRDRNTLNCRRSNLRWATMAQNLSNRIHPKSVANGWIGVYRNKSGSYRGRISVNGHVYFTKAVRTPLEAAIDRDRLALLHHGEFATLNFPESTGLICEGKFHGTAE